MLTRSGVRARAAFTLLEMLITMVLLSVVVGSLLKMISGQQRFYREVGDVMDVKANLRPVSDILPSELRGVSASGGDVYDGYFTESSVDFRSTFGTTMACRIPTTTTIAIPPNTTLTAGNQLSFWTDVPAVGDNIFIFDDGANSARTDDSWATRSITAVASTTNACTGTTYTGVGDAALTGYTLTLNSALPATVVAGAPIRLYRRVRYAFFQASDSKWYLGYCRSSSLTTQCTSLNPIAGPYRAYSATDGQSGLSFYYYDAAGAATTARFQIARIDVAVRTETQNALEFGKSTAGVFRDTTRISIGLRNKS